MNLLISSVFIRIVLALQEEYLLTDKEIIQQIVLSGAAKGYTPFILQITREVL